MSSKIALVCPSSNVRAAGSSELIFQARGVLEKSTRGMSVAYALEAIQDELIEQVTISVLRNPSPSKSSTSRLPRMR